MGLLLPHDGHPYLRNDLDNLPCIQKGLEFWYDERNLPVQIGTLANMSRYPNSAGGQRLLKSTSSSWEYYALDGDAAILVLLQRYNRSFITEMIGSRLKSSSLVFLGQVHYDFPDNLSGICAGTSG